MALICLFVAILYRHIFLRIKRVHSQIFKLLVGQIISNVLFLRNSIEFPKIN